MQLRSLGRIQRAKCGAARRPNSSRSAGPKRVKKVCRRAHAALRQDAGFKRHEAQVEKALSKFDNVAEWADFISFLSRLLKVLQTAPKYNVIPHKLTVAKRLSQCLNPALPSGVHSRALELYTHIFTVLGVDGLRRDLSIWTPGLLPFFAHAATAVKPVVLGMYERFYLPLGVDLRPLTRALQLSLLPGLEEEASEYFDRVVTLLDRIAASVQEPFFFQTLWKVLISSPTVRLCALNYAARRMLPSKGDMLPSRSDVVLLSSAMTQTLYDDALLVRRQALDFLTQFMPLSSQRWQVLPPASRASLLDAALATVLRRDISLNRRLYAWLLGPSDEEATQQSYFQAHALESVRQALQDSLAQPVATPRPYKILVSLMDKQPVAQPLMQAMVLDVFAALASYPDVSALDDIYPTAQTLFEAMDPHVLYQQQYHALVAQMREMEHPSRRDNTSPQDGKAVYLFQRTLEAFHPHDEESLRLHLPVMCLACVGQVETGLATRALPAELGLALLRLVESMMSFLNAYSVTPGPSSEGVVPSLTEPAELWYSEGGVEAVPTLQDPKLTRVWVDALLHVALHLSPASHWPEEARVAATMSCWAILQRLLVLWDAARDNDETLSPVKLDLTVWDEPLRLYMENAASFTEVEAAMRMAMHFSASPMADGRFQLEDAALQEVLLGRIVDALQPPSFRFHGAATSLLRDLDVDLPADMSTRYFCTQLAGSSTQRSRTSDALGTLWRLNESSRASLLAPVLAILDGLRSHDAVTRHHSELWLYTYVSSYEPLLVLLMDQLVHVPAKRVLRTIPISGREVSAFEYDGPTDQAYTDYYVTTITALMAVGRTRLLRSAHETSFEWPADVERHGITDGSMAEVLTQYVIMVLRSSSKHAAEEEGQATNALCLELLRQFLSHEPQQAWCESVAAALVEILLLAMHFGRTATQVMLLHLLREVLVVQHSTTFLAPDMSATYADLLQRGLCATPNDTVLYAWIDFAHAILTLLRDNATSLVLPLCTTVRMLLVGAMRQCDAPRTVCLAPHLKIEATRVPSTELEMCQLVSMLEHALGLALSSQVQNESELVRRGESSGSFLGNISSVFVGDSGAAAAAAALAQQTPVLRQAADAVHVLEYAWAAAREDGRVPAVLQRSQAALERFYQLHTSSTLEAIVEHWWHCVQASESSTVDDETVALVDCLAPSPQIVVSSLCDSISARLGGSDRYKKQTRACLVSEGVLFKFLELYAERLPQDAVAPVWPVVAMLAKSAANSTNKAYAFYTLRLVTSVSVRMARTQRLDDARTRREVQESFVKMAELVVSLYARSLDISSSTSRDSDAPSVLSEKDGEAVLTPPPPPLTVVQFLGEHVLPAYAVLNVDNDKVQSFWTSMVYYIITPGFRARGRQGDGEPAVLETLERLSRLPSTVKAWRTPVWDSFTDARFFAQSSSNGRAWAPIVASLLKAERERLGEVIGRITPAPTSNLFTSREADLLARVVSLRRLSYAVYVSDRNAFLAQLPQMQEKVVEILRAQPVDIVQAEVYLCMRVLLCRFSSQHLTGFWPIILTDMLRILGHAKTRLPADNSEQLLLLFHVAKLTDLLLTLQTEDFQIHQWLFITDTPDAALPTTEWIPESLLDALGALTAKAFPARPTQDATLGKRASQRQPLLQMTKVDSVATLEPFFLNASRAFYDSQLEGQVDKECVDECLLRDLFEPIRTRLS